MSTRSLVVGYFHPIFLTNSDTPQVVVMVGSFHSMILTATAL